MSPLPATLKGFICVFLLMIWTTCISLGNGAPHRLNSWLGCQVVMPCQGYSTKSNSFKWFFKKNEQNGEIRLFFQDRNGVKYHHSLHNRKHISDDHSLLISNFTEEDEGTYRCETCYEENCKSEQQSVKKVILTETQETFNVTAGSSFINTCSGELPYLIKWTFEASFEAAALRRKAQTPEMIMETRNNMIHIVNVKSSHDGIYTCWASLCGGPSQKLRTINLNVIKGGETEPSNGDPSGSLTWKTSQIMDGNTTVTGSNVLSAALNTTTGVSTEPANLKQVICGVSVSLTCFILIALLIFCLRSRLRAAFHSLFSCCAFVDKEEEESAVIYSSIIFRAPDKARFNHMNYSECVYSELKM